LNDLKGVIHIAGEPSKLKNTNTGRSSEKRRERRKNCYVSVCKS
jgi:hypothetical protein